MQGQGRSARSVAIEAAYAAGAAVRERYGQVTGVRFKGEADIVTDADHASERIILDYLARYFPNDSILAEESGDIVGQGGTTEALWVIDPLDGTTNFAHGYPFFAVSIGREVQGERTLGVVYAPVLDEFFVAERGKGAYLNGRRLAASTTTDLVHGLLASGFGYDRELAQRNVVYWDRFLPVTQGLRRDGSSALNFCYVAAGRFDGYWEMGIRHWDAAAGVLMVTEEGGQVSRFDGLPYKGDALDCVASNGLLHVAMLETIGVAESFRGERG